MPDLHAEPVLLIILPMPLIPGSLGINVCSSPVGLVVRPLALVDVAINVIEFPLAKSMPVVPLAFILGTIQPAHGTSPVSEATKPLSVVHGLILVLISFDIGLLLSLEDPVQSFLGFFLRKVLALLLYSKVRG
jgi:hypothetical protein